MLIGTDVDVIKKAIDGPSIKKSSGYLEVEDRFSGAADGLLFADNSGSKFVNFLQPLEKKWKMTLLLSAEYLEWMGYSFDVIDSTRVAGKRLISIIYRVFIILDSPTYANRAVKSSQFAHEIFTNAFPNEKRQPSPKHTTRNRTFCQE